MEINCFISQKIKSLKFIVLVVLSVLLLLSVLQLSSFAQEEEVATPFLIGTGDFAFTDGIYYEAEFRFPYGIVYDETTDKLLIADVQNHRIRQLDLESFKVSTLAGTSSQVDRFGFPAGGHRDGDADEAMFRRPRGLAVAPNGAVYVADTGNHSIRQIYNGMVYTVAGSGAMGHKDDTGLEAQFWNPSGIVIDSEGNIFISDTLNHVIRKMDENGDVTTFAGEPGNTDIFFEPTGLAIDKEDTLYVADSANQQIKTVDKNGHVRVLSGFSEDIDEETEYLLGAYVDGRAADARFNFPRGVAVNDDGFVFIADAWNHTIRAISPSGRVYTVAGAGISGFDWDEDYITKFDGPSGITYALDHLFITDYWNNRIVAIPATSEYLRPLIHFSESKSTIPVYVDGTEVRFPDAEPFIAEDDQVRVPLRFVAEEWGANVYWDGIERVVTVSLHDHIAYLSEADGDFFIHEDRSMVRLRTLIEKLGFYVEWREKYRAVVIETFPY